MIGADLDDDKRARLKSPLALWNNLFDFGSRPLAQLSQLEYSMNTGDV